MPYERKIGAFQKTLLEMAGEAADNTLEQHVFNTMLTSFKIWPWSSPLTVATYGYFEYCAEQQQLALQQ